jgi:drug/metabolite transporter (DMT)-like permease
MQILILCVVLNALIGVIFKLYGKYNIQVFQAIVVNYLTCVATAGVVMGKIPIPANLFSKIWFPYALGLGIVFILTFNLMALTVRHFGVVVASVFQKMSLIAPALIAILIYSEPSGWLKWSGIALALISVVLLSYQKNVSHNSSSEKYIFLLPVMTFLLSCVIDSSLYLLQYHEIVMEGDPEFVATLFLSAGLTGLLFLLWKISQGKATFTKPNVIAGIALGIPNFFSIYLLILVLEQGWGASVVFPVNNVGVLLLSGIFGIVLFKERPDKFKWSGYVLAIFAILFIVAS